MISASARACCWRQMSTAISLSSANKFDTATKSRMGLPMKESSRRLYLNPPERAVVLPYAWTKTADQILAGIGNNCNRINDSGH